MDLERQNMTAVLNFKGFIKTISERDQENFSLQMVGGTKGFSKVEFLKGLEFIPGTII